MGERLEAMLYSDAQVTGEATGVLGPYDLLNALPHPRRRLASALVLRAELCLEVETDMSRTQESGFHGGDIFEEVAALLSLSLGIRCRSGGRARMWTLDNDPLGRPIEFDHDPPFLPSPQSRGAVIPSMVRTVAVTDASAFLQRYAATDSDSAIAIVRAARLYQQATWMAEADPNQAWIQLVSAIEVAAEQWGGTNATPLERLREAWPELANLIESKGNEHAESVAGLVAALVKSQSRFLRFMDRFLPAPPQERPHDWARVNWNEMQAHLKTVYGYRSRALHAGTPFPEPMCEPPRMIDTGPPIEKPMGLATQVNDSTWLAKDTPMLLATFEHVARGALQSWWMEIPPE